MGKIEWLSFREMNEGPSLGTSPALCGFAGENPPADFFLIFFIIFYLFLAVLGLRCCTWAFSSCGEWGLLFAAVHRLLIVVASLVAEHGL